VTAASAPQPAWERALYEAIDRYHDILTAYIDRGGEDHEALLARMAARGAVFAGRPVCTSLRPQFLLRSQVDRLTRAAHLFRSACSKARDAVLDDPALLDLVGLTDGERRLLELNPEFKSFGVVARLDTILSGSDLSIVELNTEGAFGGSYSDRLSDLFQAFQPLRELCLERPIRPFYAGSSLVGAVLDTWYEFGGTSLPRVAVVDWNEVATRAEFDIVCDRFERHGVHARFVDPRELEYAEGELRARGEGIDVVYRRALTSELLAREDEVRPLFDAYRARVVCVVNSFRAQLLDKKILLALLFDDRVAARCTDDELAVIRAHVPWTRRVDAGPTTAPDGSRVDLLEWASDHRAELVLKPNDGLGGRGVILGASVAQDDWERALATAVHDPAVVQRRVPLPTAMFPELGPAGELSFSRRYVEIDTYLFRGEPSGIMTRLSSTTMSSVHAGAGIVPTFVLEDA
jgi:hypothetical protein